VKTKRGIIFVYLDYIPCTGGLQQIKVKKRLLWGQERRLCGLPAAGLFRKVDRNLEALEEDVEDALRFRDIDQIRLRTILEVLVLEGAGAALQPGALFYPKPGPAELVPLFTPGILRFSFPRNQVR